MLPAFTNKVGTHSIVEPFLERNYNPITGESNERITYFRTKHSHKSDTVAPLWQRDNGVVVFKQPSSYLRVVDNRTNPEITGTHRNGDGNVFNVFSCHASDRMGNHPDLHHMPRIMEQSSDYPFVDQNQINRAEVECLLKFKESGAQLGNALAEAKSTVDMIAGNVSQLAKTLIALKKGNFRSAWTHLSGGRSISGFAASNFLQWKFGWDPLISDIADGVGLLKKQFNVNNLILGERRNLRYDNSWELNVPGNAGNCRVKGKGSHLTSVALWCRLNPDPWRRAAEASGLDNPLGILWEVTPWSFVVDWVAPVGPLLDALMVHQGLEFVGGYWSVRAQGTNIIDVPKYPDPLLEETKVNANVERFAFRRSAYAELPFPKPYVKSPFSSSHTITAAALLRQLMGLK